MAYKLLAALDAGTLLSCVDQCVQAPSKRMLSCIISDALPRLREQPGIFVLSSSFMLSFPSLHWCGVISASDLSSLFPALPPVLLALEAVVLITERRRKVTGKCSCFVLCAADSACRVTAEGQSEHDALVAYAARRWLAHHAAGVKFFSIEDQGAWHDAAIPACASLVSCLPALESARLQVPGPLAPDNVGCLLEALASRPALTTLELIMMHEYFTWHRPNPLGCAAAFAKLRSLTKLALTLCDKHPYTLAEVVGALVSLTSLTDLFIRKDCSDVSPPETLPAALRQLKALQTLCFEGLKDCVMDAGCLDLPDLQCLRFPGCNFYYAYDADEDAQLLPSITALQSLTSIDLSDSDGPPCFAQLVNLPRLQRMDFSANESLFCLGLSMLPADMGSLSLMLNHLDISGRGLTQFPLALRCPPLLRPFRG